MRALPERQLEKPEVGFLGLPQVLFSTVKIPQVFYQSFKTTINAIISLSII